MQSIPYSTLFLYSATLLLKSQKSVLEECAWSGKYIIPLLFSAKY